jgi:cardiolipin synthase A/B
LVDLRRIGHVAVHAKQIVGPTDLAPMLLNLSITHWLTLHGLVTVAAVLIYVISAHVLRQRRAPAAAIAWMLFILLMPYVALPAFLAFGSRKLARPNSSTHPHAPRAGATDADAWAVETIVALGQPEPAPYSDLNLHQDGHAARDALLNTIDGARASIDLCTFILRHDALGDRVLDRLCERAQRGLRVRLMLDGMGRLMARSPSLKPLVKAGGEVALFVRPLRSPLKGRTNLRNHRKLLLADGTLPTARLWCGGRNLAAEYFDGEPGAPPWRDLSFDLRGPMVRQASNLFERDWAFASGQPQAAAPLPAQPEPPSAAPAPSATAQLVASGPDQADDTLHALLVTAAYRARKRIALATPYFVLESALLMALCLASRRGVVVDLLVPARSNHPLSDMARGRGLRSLAQAGGRIWLAPGMMHAKLAVIDETLALAGSANLDSRSLFLNYELMVAFHETTDVRRYADWFDRERMTATPFIATQPGLIRDMADGMLLWVGFQL